MTTHRSHVNAAGMHLRQCCIALCSMMLLAGCAPLTLTAVGVGSAAGVQHTLNGIAYRTFTTPLPQVRSAAVASLNRMGIKVDKRDKSDEGEIIKARASGREIEIELEALTPNMTRMRTSVRNGLFMDAATSTEIILQTERILANGRAALTGSQL